MPKKFQSKNQKEEVELIKTDNSEFSKAREYIGKLVEDALGHFELKKEQYDKLYIEILGDIPIAVNRYLNNIKIKKTDIDYKFSVYFTWYISQRINAVKNIQKKNAH
ncbi:MAG: hypothetical protein Q7R53_01570 [bacterium]|nr:hypothetical protein [bacterium]